MPGQGIDHELSLGEVISRTFDLYRRNFVTYLVLFLVVEAIFAVLTFLIGRVASFPNLLTNPTPQQVSDWLSASLGALVLIGLATLVAAVVVFPIAVGAAVKLASDEIQDRPPDIMGAARFSASKLLYMWALGIIVGIIVFLGLIALIIPGIILAIMFCLVLQPLLLENAGVLGSMSRSRELVGHRWLKTFATFLVLGIIILIISVVLSFISLAFGPASSFASTILGALTAPIGPISLTVYYYSNLARLGPAQTGRPSMGPAMVAPPGMKFCPNCGAQLESSATFCPKCGAKQPT